MSATEVLWGLVVIAAGVFICVYGTRLFRFALAAMGFGIGFLAAMRIFDSQDDVARVLIAFAVGGIGAFALYSLVRFTFYIAGGVLGLVLGFVVVGVIDLFTSQPGDVTQTILAVVGAALGAFFGNRLGNLVVLLGSAAAGSFLVVNGLHVLFESQFNVDAADPIANVTTRLSLTVLAIVFAIAALGQYSNQSFRNRVLGR